MRWYRDEWGVGNYVIPPSRRARGPQGASCCVASAAFSTNLSARASVPLQRTTPAAGFSAQIAHLPATRRRCLTLGNNALGSVRRGPAGHGQDDLLHGHERSAQQERTVRRVVAHLSPRSKTSPSYALLRMISRPLPPAAGRPW
jgi:hypothetical protein